MSEVAIRVDNLSKQYKIGVKRSGSFRETFSNVFRRKREEAADASEFWALKDVSFEIKRGEAVGIIGKNGAGKSTLLKILSRITEPTHGRIEINGRVASLLEVGTGFHPELTGRENIYMNGTILGMNRHEIRAKFNEITEFSGCGKFIDSPVKHYSSGMYVRLAFAVAAHLEPEILIIDEVLAVGDAEFQKKCLGKMKDVTGQGRTVIFVSHNLTATERLCSSGILLNKGKLQQRSYHIRSLINTYLSTDNQVGEKTEWLNLSNSFSNHIHTVQRFALTDESGFPLANGVRNDENIWVEIEGTILAADETLNIGYALFGEDGTLIYWTFCKDSVEEKWPKLEKGHFKIKSVFPARLLNEGVYRLELLSGLHLRKWLIAPDSDGPAISFEIRGGLSDSPYFLTKRNGLLAPIIDWNK